MIFVPTIINHTLPQVSVTIADSGVPPITYNSVKASLGNYVYNVEALYMQSNQLNQLIGTIQYNRYDAAGDKSYVTITTTIDPYQYSKSLFQKLDGYGPLFILNGNSSFSTTILPLATIDLTLYTKRITNSFGRNLNSFKIIEEIFRKPDFFKRYGDIKEIQKTNERIERTLSFTGENDENNSLGVLAFIFVSLGIAYIINQK